jgi:hypothetical protein
MRTRTLTRLALATMLAGSTAPSVAASGCTDLTALPVTPGVMWNDVWQALNDQSSCTQNCHLGSAPSGGLDFSSRDIAIYFLVGQPSNQDSALTLVEPGDPRASLLLQKVNCDSPDFGARMPLGGQLAPSLQALIYDWIRGGAQGESAEDPIARDYVFADGIEPAHQ